ncbi:uncharacterized protein PAC_19062 [Phialocephala subalpina]|uniref:Uncharacterized protein n=1 Tax=Phialocephala subalpina TaxID=576137 RepID=A0A1L7XVS5_9HELO|nr:uncharacterized protein PAC_19062 [Phialocephala subalpina]
MEFKHCLSHLLVIFSSLSPVAAIRPLEYVEHSKRATCNANNCLRALLSPQHSSDAIAFCETYIPANTLIIPTTQVVTETFYESPSQPTTVVFATSTSTAYSTITFTHSHTLPSPPPGFTTATTSTSSTISYPTNTSSSPSNTSSSSFPSAPYTNITIPTRPPAVCTSISAHPTSFPTYSYPASVFGFPTSYPTAGTVSGFPTSAGNYSVGITLAKRGVYPTYPTFLSACSYSSVKISSACSCVVAPVTYVTSTATVYTVTDAKVTLPTVTETIHTIVVQYNGTTTVTLYEP